MVRFWKYYREGDVLYDEDVWVDVYAPKELSKSEVIAHMSLNGIFEEGEYKYEGLIMPVTGFDNSYKHLGYYHLDKQEEYAEAVELYRKEGKLPQLGIVFSKQPEKG